MICNVDAKSLEWVTYLFLSQDKVGIDEWIAVVEDPKKNDMHTANQTAFNLPSRLISKIFLFRALYKGSAYAYSKDPDFAHVSKSVDFWQTVIDNFYKKYAGLNKTHQEYIKTAITTGKLTSPFGRTYQFKPFIKPNGEIKWNESDITNWPNQGCGADVMAVYRVLVHSRFRRYNLKSKLISTVHDSVVADCPDQEVGAVSEIMTDCFKCLPQAITKAYGVKWNLPMLGEVSIGTNMLELTEV